MEDGRKNNGGHKTAGRKPKASELELVERLSPMEDEALEQLKIGVKNGDFKFIQLYFSYRFGKPKETIDATIKQSIIEWVETKTYEKE